MAKELSLFFLLLHSFQNSCLGVPRFGPKHKLNGRQSNQCFTHFYLSYAVDPTLLAFIIFILGLNYFLEDFSIPHLNRSLKKLLHQFHRHVSAYAKEYVLKVRLLAPSHNWYKFHSIINTLFLNIYYVSDPIMDTEELEMNTMQSLPSWGLSWGEETTNKTLYICYLIQFGS